MEIAPGIHMITGTVGTRPLQLFLLNGEHRRVLLDTGCAPDPERLVMPYLESLGLGPADLDLVIVTHPDTDHCGGNSAIRKANPKVLIACGEADRELVERPDVLWSRRYNAYCDRHCLCYGEEVRRWNFEMLGSAAPVDFTWTGFGTLRLEPGWVVEIHLTPGHSPGHLSVYDPRSRTVLIGDAVQGSVYLDTEGRPALCPTYLHVDSYLATVRYLRTLGPETLAGCHWPVKRGPEVDAFLAETANFVEMAEREVLAALQCSPSGASLREIIGAVSPRLGGWPPETSNELMYALSGHVDRLAAIGKIVGDERARPWRYFRRTALPEKRTS